MAAAFEALEGHASAGPALAEDGFAADAFGVVDVHPRDRQGHALKPEAAEAAAAVHGEHLQLARPAQRSGAGCPRVRNESIEAGALLVFGEVDDAGARVHRRRFVLEAPQASKGYRIAGTIGGNFEDVAVRAFHALAPRVDGGLFAAQPAAPRGDAASAVLVGAGQRDAGRKPIATAQVETQRGGAAAASGIVEGRRRQQRRQGDLMVAHESHGTAVGVHEGAHAVVQAGDDVAVVGRLEGPAERLAAKARRQFQQRRAGGFVQCGNQLPGRSGVGGQAPPGKTGQGARGRRGHENVAPPRHASNATP